MLLDLVTFNTAPLAARRETKILLTHAIATLPDASHYTIHHLRAYQNMVILGAKDALQQLHQDKLSQFESGNILASMHKARPNVSAIGGGMFVSVGRPEIAITHVNPSKLADAIQKEKLLDKNSHKKDLLHALPIAIRFRWDRFNPSLQSHILDEMAKHGGGSPLLGSFFQPYCMLSSSIAVCLPDSKRTYDLGQIFAITDRDPLDSSRPRDPETGRYFSLSELMPVTRVFKPALETTEAKLSM